MKIYRALKSNILTQGFKCKPSMESFYESLGMAKGIHGAFDWASRDGEKLYFDCDCKGYVLNTEIDNKGGLGINIITETDGLILKHRYWHLRDFNVKAGQVVETGDLIGWADNTGYSTGHHLHRDAKEMGKNSNGSLYIKNYDNGSFGTIDYSPYFKNAFVLDIMDNLQGQVSILKKIIKIINDFLKGRV